MIIDVRFRPPYKGYLKLHVFSDNPARRPPLLIGEERASAKQESVVKKSVPLAIEEMRRAGITKALVIGRRAIPPFENVPNEDILSFVREYPGLFYAVPALEPTDRYAALDELEYLRTQPEVKGIHMEPGWAAQPMYADDAKLYPIYERLSKVGMTLLISSGGTIGPDFSYVDPVHLHRVAKDFPQLKIVVGHGGWPYVHQALAVAYDCANVHLSPDMYLNVPNTPGSLEYVRAANFYLRDRLLFGTAYPSRPLVESVQQFNLLPFDEGVKERVLYHNAARVFDIE